MRVEALGFGHDGRALRFTVEFDTGEVQLTATPFGTLVHLDGFGPGGQPGGPGLPRARVRVAVPAGMWPTEIVVGKDTWSAVVDEPVFVAPVQPLRAGPDKRRQHEGDEHETHDLVQDHECRCDCGWEGATPRPPRPSQFNIPPVVPPDEDRYASAVRSPRPVLGAVGIESVGDIHVALIEVNPVRLSRKGVLQLCTRLDFFVGFAAEPPVGDRAAALADFAERFGEDLDPERVVVEPSRMFGSALDAERQISFTAQTLVNPGLVAMTTYWPIVDYLPSQYLVITDDFEWDAATIRKGTPRPGMVAEFTRLTRWKRARGVSSRVVTISDIVGGRYGDFRTGSRDLQEVLRTFLKSARERWGVSWVLLGGDIEVVPIRQVAGAVIGYIDTDAKATPDDNKSYWTGSHLRMHCVNPGDWWSASAANTLVNSSTGQVIPYDGTGASGTTSPGWYFATDDTYATRTTMATNFVRVNGPASLVNGRLQFLYHWNSIPTDFYYSSLDSWVLRPRRVDLPFGLSFEVPYVYRPHHDWDAVGNGIYGQHDAGGTDLDGVILRADLSVGRAPASDSTDAATFVDKVLAYERYGGGGLWRPLHGDWPLKMLLASTDWGGDFAVCTATASNPPTAGTYHHQVGSTQSLLNVDTVPEFGKWQVVAEISASDRRALPYLSDPAAAARGWYFAKSGTDLSPSSVHLSFPWFSIDFPVPTSWIVVKAAGVELDPSDYRLDEVGPDGSMLDQESLRKQMRVDFPQINQVSRLYADDLDLPWADRIAAPVAQIGDTAMRAALDSGPHFVSLSGHGNGDGCCDLSRWVADGLTNGLPGFIAFADSCLTSELDAPDACSEHLMNNPNGGACAYVGNSRFSWIGAGDNFQRAFFHRLRSTRHLGLLNDSKVAVYGTTGSWLGYDRWVIFEQNLLGCPEMPVYRDRVPELVIRVKNPRLDKPIEIDVQWPPTWPPGPPVQDSPRDGQPNVVFRVQQGDQLWELTADADGRAVLPVGTLAPGEFEVTAVHDGAVPAHLAFDLADPVWVTGRVCEVVQETSGDTSVWLDSGGERRACRIGGEHLDRRVVLDAIENALLAGRDIDLLLDDDGAVERFRMTAACGVVPGA